jgi:hypothetical protein
MLFASGVGTVGIAVITGGLAGAIVTGVIGPILTDRQGRYESYRKWQLDLGNEVLTKVAEIRMKLVSDSRAPASSDLVEELDVLAQRVDLIFVRHKNTPAAAKAMVAAARLKPPDLQAFDQAREKFVSCASDEIRARGRWNRTRS